MLRVRYEGGRGISTRNGSEEVELTPKVLGNFEEAVTPPVAEAPLGDAQITAELGCVFRFPVLEIEHEVTFVRNVQLGRFEGAFRKPLREARADEYMRMPARDAPNWVGKIDQAEGVLEASEVPSFRFSGDGFLNEGNGMWILTPKLLDEAELLIRAVVDVGVGDPLEPSPELRSNESSTHEDILAAAA